MHFSSSPTSKPAWTASKIRKQFIDFFVEENAHTFVVSSPTIPLDDQTLLFANSGMAQFKSVFQSTVDPNSPFAKLRRAANTQKCIRAGGKHNDLDDVGKDTYHHTFFEMLGNWSFGDYFKREAIEMAWKLLTTVYQLDPGCLYVTYFEGNPTLGIPADIEAKEIWLSCGVASSHILPFGMKENFWEMGESGPCGPCSEIHYDRIGGGRDASHLVNYDDPMVIEIWNLVFMQFNREADGSLRLLPNQHVDTGMGFERLVSVLQNKPSNYDTDVFAGIFEAISRGCNIRPYSGLVGEVDLRLGNGVDTAYRVIADHIRTLSVAISDGGSPSNEGRGYVLRRILRRAIRYAHEKLHATQGFLSSLVPVAIDSTIGDAFPELHSSIARIQAIINEEELQFRKTLDRGILQFSKFAKAAKESSHLVMDGAFAWKLYDTYGFPLDLTVLMAEEQGLTVDKQGYLEAQAAAKEISKGTFSGLPQQDSNNASLLEHTLSQFSLNVHKLEELSKLGIPPTDDEFKYSHVPERLSSKLLAIFNILACGHSDRPVENLCASMELIPCALIFSRTNMYAESGGQIGDTGSISTKEDVLVDVKDVRRFGSYIVHLGLLTLGSSLSINVDYDLSYDAKKRSALRRNHTGTHLLNWAISSTIADSSRTDKLTDQKGSLVASDRLRFDYGAPNPPFSIEEFVQIEQKIEYIIRSNAPVITKVVPLAEARRISNLRAVFGEVYPDPVRVVMAGENASVELCGGTHVSQCGDISDFVLIQDNLIAKGIRRIVALTGPEAIEAKSSAKSLKTELDALDVADPKGSVATLSTLKSLAKKIDDTDLPIAEKFSLRQSLATARKQWDDNDKARKAAMLQSMTKEFEDLLLFSTKPVIKAFEGADGKILSSALTSFKGKKIPALLLSHDIENGAVSLIAYVPTSFNVASTAWIDAIGSLVSAKYGASKGGEVVQGTGTANSVCIIKEVIHQASIFANKHFN